MYPLLASFVGYQSELPAYKMNSSCAPTANQHDVESFLLKTQNMYKLSNKPNKNREAKPDFCNFACFR